MCISRRRLLGHVSAGAGAAVAAGIHAVQAPPAHAAGRATGSVRITRMVTEHAVHPLGIDARQPRLSWVLESGEHGQAQTAYRVLVASGPEILARDQGDVWDSGTIRSGRSTQVAYGGPALESRRRYHWKVRAWDADGKASAWSAPGWWEMGLLRSSDWTARWVSHDGPIPIVTSNTKQNYPAQLTSGGTLGQTFTTDRPFDSAGGRFPTWHTTDSDVTLSLYRGDGPGGALVARQRFTNLQDNAWVDLPLEEPLDAGVYYLEQSELNGKAGWWSHHDDVYAYGRAYADDARVAGDRTIRWHPDAAPADERTSQLRREFSLNKEIADARVHSTAAGLYELEINGRRVGQDHFAPGWTDYHTRLQYQTYDVTELLRRGRNAIGARLAPGWYSGRVAMYGEYLYGRRPSLLVQLEVTYADGSTDRVITDDAWRSTVGPILASDILDGEIYDARRETPGWTTPGFDDWRWQRVRLANSFDTRLVSQAAPTVQQTGELRPAEITEPSPGVYVFDMAQNMVGSVRLRVRGGQVGDRIKLRHGEMLNPDGSLYTENLRTAKATDFYTCKGAAEETYEPRFTFHGFRYVEVTGFPGTPGLDTITGRVIGTAAPVTGEFSTSSAMLNQLQSNIAWSQRGNFLSIPTDCPQRDERMGWTGDINVFASTAAFNMDSARFLGDKWLTDLRDAQFSDGAFPDVAPFVPLVGGGTAGWGDAGVTVPYTIWQTYGDTRVIEENYGTMTRWIEYLKAHSDGYLRPAAGYGDWLNVNDPTPKDLIGTAYFAHSTQLLSRMAAAIGHDGDAAAYRRLFRNVRAAFRDAYVSEDGRLQGDSQTGYVLALSFDLLPQRLRDRAASHLVRRIEERDWHLSTGFLGTPDLLPVLTETGHTDVAYRLLGQRTYPSWGYEIEKGATTTWEHWDSVKPDGGFEDPAMNSFNHYAYGAVGTWMYRTIAGINPDPDAPGYKRFTIHPRPGGGLTHANARHDSPYGPIISEWSIHSDREFRLDVQIPVNTTATIYVPATDRHRVSVTPPAQFLRMEGDFAVYKAGSGRYTFVSHGVRG